MRHTHITAAVVGIAAGLGVAATAADAMQSHTSAASLAQRMTPAEQQLYLDRLHLPNKTNEVCFYAGDRQNVYIAFGTIQVGWVNNHTNWCQTLGGNLVQGTTTITPSNHEVVWANDSKHKLTLGYPSGGLGVRRNSCVEEELIWNFDGTSGHAYISGRVAFDTRGPRVWTGSSVTCLTNIKNTTWQPTHS